MLRIAILSDDNRPLPSSFNDQLVALRAHADVSSVVYYNADQARKWREGIDADPPLAEQP